MSTASNSWKLVKFTPESFAGIDKDMGMVVMFDNAKEDQNITSFSGDQAVGKTSMLNGLKTILGGLLPENAINSKDKKVSAKAIIQLDGGKELEVSVGKDNFKLWLKQEVNGVPSRSPIDSPKTFMQKLIGPVGVSPLFLQDMNGEKQVKWLREIAKLDDKALEMEAQITEGYKKTFDQRTAVNRDVKQLTGELNQSPYFEFDKTNKVYVPTEEFAAIQKQVASGAGDADKVNAAFAIANNENNLLVRSIEYMDALIKDKYSRNKDIANIDEQIAQLQKIKENTEAELVIIQGKIKTGEDKIRELADAPQRFEAAQKAVFAINEVLRKKQDADTDQYKANRHAQSVESSESLSAKLEEYQTKQRQLIQLITPNVEGIEVKVKRTIDPAEEEDNYRKGNPDATDAQVKAYLDGLGVGNVDGLFYKGRSVDQLCESELWDLCLVLWKHTGVNVIFIENINTLGSDAIERINWFAQYGKVFYSEMKRGTKDLKITFQNKIPVNEPAEEVED